MPPNSSNKCEVTSWLERTPEAPQTKPTPGTTSPDVPETSPTIRTLGTISEDAYEKWKLIYLRDLKGVAVETSFFDEPANGSRGSTWQTPPKALPPVISPNDRLVIDKLVSAQTKFQEVPECYFVMIQPFPWWEEKKETMKDKLMQFNHLAELTNLQLELSRAFCRRLPGIEEIPANDALRLYEAHREVRLFIRYARRYDQSIDAIRVVAGKPPYTKEHFRNLYRTKATEALFHLFRTKMTVLQLDEVEYALFQAIAFFEICPDLEQPILVKKQRMYYSGILKDYMQAKADPSRLLQLEDVYQEMDSLKGNMRKPSFHQ